MNYANWASGFPLLSSTGEDNYITVNGHGEWTDRGDMEDHCEIICQDLAKTGKLQLLNVDLHFIH